MRFCGPRYSNHCVNVQRHNLELLMVFQLSTFSAVVDCRWSKDKLRGVVTSFVDDPGGKISGSNGCLSDIPKNVLVFLTRS
jgi:hypothetical protein